MLDWFVDWVLPTFTTLLCIVLVVAIAAVPLCYFLNKNTPLSCGEVYEKEFLPASREMRWMPLTTYNAASKTTHVQMIPYWITKPDRYVVRIKAYVEEDWQYGEWFVPHDTWEAVEIGSMFEASTKRGDSDKEPYTKTKVEG